MEHTTDGWIEWAGGTMEAVRLPVPREEQVEVQYRGGNTEKASAGTFDWWWSPSKEWGFDIVAYRPAATRTEEQ